MTNNKPNLPRVVRRNFGKNSREKQNQAQSAMNRLLWKIIANQGGRLMVKCSELDSLPKNAAITTDYDVKNHTIVMSSIIREPMGGLVIPDKGIITN